MNLTNRVRRLERDAPDSPVVGAASPEQLQAWSEEFVAIAMSDATELPPHLARPIGYPYAVSLEAFRSFMARKMAADRAASVCEEV